MCFVACSGGGGDDGPAGRTRAAKTYIRTGGPSAPADTKIAVVMSDRDLADAKFEVVGDDGRVVLDGTLRDAGAWGHWEHLGLADFSSVHAPGTYVVHAVGAKSHTWDVRDDTATDAITAMLRGFAAQHDGNEPSPLHGPAHLKDALLDGKHIDLTGGWMDAGDMLHFTETTSYSAVVLQLAARLDAASAQPLNTEADVGIRWLRKAHPASGVFVGQVGELIDHDIGFRDPAADDASEEDGIGERVATKSTGSSLAGKTAAALALASMRAPSPEREALIAAADEWYQAGLDTDGPGPKLPGGFYVATSWNDDLALGAVMLFRATGDGQYLTDAKDLLDGLEVTDVGWDDVAAIAGADLCGALGAPAVDDAAARDAGCALLRDATEQGRDTAEETVWGTPGPFGWSSTAPNSGYAAIAAVALHAGIVDDAPYAARARDWLFGDNPWGASFVVGFGAEPARHPHHWAARDGDPEPVGQVVGGPAPIADINEQGFDFDGPFDTRRAAYEDNTEDYVTSETTIDGTVNAIFMVAALNAR
jgi:hypothetical protein